jgi:hypothetical protein
MVRKNVYIAFDFDDLGVKQNLIAEARRPDCPWSFVDNSISAAIPDRWAEDARRLIKQSECIIVLCGEQTHQAKGVAIEVQLAQELGKPYFLLSGSRRGTPTKPMHARVEDKIWTYRWPTVLTLLSGGTPSTDAIVR